jgi:4-amino-4-deoxy-L-arabinose transferase-like glycosyltransferase
VLAALLALMVAPTVWAAYPVRDAANGSFPLGGPVPDATGGRRGAIQFGGFTIAQQGGAPAAGADARLIAYLEANRRGARWALAVQSSQTASPLIIASGLPVMAIGGFSGNDPILTAAGFAKLVAEGQVRFVLAEGFGLGRVGNPGGATSERPRGEDAPRQNAGGRAIPPQETVQGWVLQNCAIVPPAAWQGADQSGISGRFSPLVGALYDCAGAGA